MQQTDFYCRTYWSLNNNKFYNKNQSVASSWPFNPTY